MPTPLKPLLNQKTGHAVTWQWPPSFLAALPAHNHGSSGAIDLLLRAMTGKYHMEVRVNRITLCVPLCWGFFILCYALKLTHAVTL